MAWYKVVRPYKAGERIYPVDWRFEYHANDQWLLEALADGSLVRCLPPSIKAYEIKGPPRKVTVTPPEPNWAEETQQRLRKEKLQAIKHRRALEQQERKKQVIREAEKEQRAKDREAGLKTRAELDAVAERNRARKKKTEKAEKEAQRGKEAQALTYQYLTPRQRVEAYSEEMALRRAINDPGPWYDPWLWRGTNGKKIGAGPLFSQRDALGSGYEGNEPGYGQNIYHAALYHADHQE